MKPEDFFSKKDQQLIIQAIQDAEKNTSGEIRVHLEAKCRGDVMDRAAFIFEKLKMHETELRNGVLFYLALDNQKFAILGDAGINEVTPDDFWDEIKDRLDQLSGLQEEIVKEGFDFIKKQIGL
jgi:uncharacterized membrane protein